MVVFQLEQREPVLVAQIFHAVAGFTGRFLLFQLLEQTLRPAEVALVRLDNVCSETREFIVRHIVEDFQDRTIATISDTVLLWYGLLAQSDNPRLGPRCAPAAEKDLDPKPGVGKPLQAVPTTFSTGGAWTYVAGPRP